MNTLRTLSHTLATQARTRTRERNRILGLKLWLIVAVLLGVGGAFAPAAHAAPQVDVRVIVQQVHALDDLDGLCGEPDFYAVLGLGGAEFRSRVIDNSDPIYPNWTFEKRIGLSGDGFSTELRLFDEDGPCGGADDPVDINDLDGRMLGMGIGVNAERCGISGFYSEGPVGVEYSELIHTGRWSSGMCRVDLEQRGNEEDSAELRIAIEIRLVSVPPLAPLYGWYSHIRGDNFATTLPEWAGVAGDRHAPDNYGFSRLEGLIFNADAFQPPDTIPLYAWYNEALRDNYITTDPAWSPARSPRDGYSFWRIEGYVYPTPRPGTVPLYTWHSDLRGDYFTTSNPIYAGEPGDTRLPDYTFVRIEGYALSTAPVSPPTYYVYIPMVT